MATITRGADIAGVVSSANIATLSAVAIGTASQDRIVVLCVGGELNQSPNSATVDYGLGPLPMTAGTLASFSTTMRARLFWLNVPTGTTATFAITWSGATTAATTHYATYAVTAAALTPTQNVNTSTDMDATAPLTAGSQTIATGGGFLAVAVGAAVQGKTWAQSTGTGFAEDLDVGTANFEFTTAMSVTAVTATLTCTGGTNGEDGALAWMLFAPGAAVSLIQAPATSGIGTLVSNPGANPVGVSGTGQAGTIGKEIDTTLVATPATVGFGSFLLESDIVLPVAVATGDFSSLEPEASIVFPDVFGTGYFSGFILPINASFDLVGAFATAAVELFRPHIPSYRITHFTRRQNILPSVFAIGEFGEFLIGFSSVEINLSSVFATGEFGYFTVDITSVATNLELREDLSRELREDGSKELRE